MGRVDNDDVRGRDVGQHAAARHLVAALGLGLLRGSRRVRLLVLLLDLFLGHPQRLFMLALLPDPVAGGDQKEGADDLLGDADRHAADLREQVARRQPDEHRELRHHRPDRHEGDAADGSDLRERLCRLHRCLLAEDALEALRRVEPLEVRFRSLGRHLEAHLQHVGEDARDDAGDHHGRPGRHEQAAGLAEDRTDAASAHLVGVGDAAEPIRHRELHLVKRRGAGDDERAEAGHQHDGAVELLRLRHLALLAGLPTTFGSGLLGLVVTGHALPSPPPDSTEGRDDRVGEIVADVDGDERERGGDHAEAHQDLHRDAKLEHVHLRHGA